MSTSASRRGGIAVSVSWLFAVLLIAIGGVHAEDEPRDVPPYRDLYTPANEGRYPYDIHAWVYPKSSATRFQMPEEWADDGLKGTLALAYRVEWLTGQTCGYEDAPKCRQRVRCVLDAYFDQPSDLPFRNELEANHDTFGGEGSAHWLTAQSESAFESIRALRRSTTLAGPVRFAYHTRSGEVNTIGINTFQYERRMYDLDQVSFQIPCTFPARLDDVDRPIGIVIGEATFSEKAVDAYVQLVAQASDAIINTIDSEKLPGANRIITIPTGFFDRWRVHHQEYMAWEEGYHDTFASAPWRRKDYTPTDYAGRFGPAAGRRVDRDIHTWTYTRDFAERFGMPEKWIAKESLGDAEALAFRVQRAVSGWCGAGFDQSNCQRYESCMWDIYLPAEAPIPWYVDWPVSNNGGGYKENSIRFLQENDSKRNQETHEVFLKTKYIYGGASDDQRAMTAPIAWQWQERRYRSLFLGFGYWKDWKWAGGVGFRVKAFDRRMLDYQLISVVGNCKSRRSFEMRRSGATLNFRDHRILFPPRGVDWVKFDSLMDVQRIEKPKALVEVMIPRRFEFRWLDHQTSTLRSGRRIEKILELDD